MKITNLIVIITGVLGVSLVANTTTIIDFQSLEHIDSSYANHGFEYIEDGFRFDELSQRDGFGTMGTLQSTYSGSTALYNNTAEGDTQLSMVNGGTFDLISIDLTEVKKFYESNVTFVRDGGHSQTFTLDHNECIPETFVFDASFTNCTTVTWKQESSYHQFDNIVVEPIINLSIRNIPDAVSIGWVSQSGVIYQVQCSTNLLAGWFNLDTVVGNGSTNFFLDSTSGSAMRVYRVNKN